MSKNSTNERLLDALDEYPPMSDEELRAALVSLGKERPGDANEDKRNHWLRLQRQMPAIEK